MVLVGEFLGAHVDYDERSVHLKGGLECASDRLRLKPPFVFLTTHEGIDNAFQITGGFKLVNIMRETGRVRRRPNSFS